MATPLTPQPGDARVASAPPTPTPPPPTRPLLRERYDRRHAELVAAAAAGFARGGYDQTTMVQLAGSMGLATGALYHYFAAKEQLLEAICDDLTEPLLAAGRTLLDGSVAEPAPQRLRELVRLWVAHVCAHRDHMLVFQQERHVIESGERWRSVRSSRKAFERLVAATLDAARAGGDGDAGDGTDSSPLALFALLGMVNHTAQWYRPRGPLTPRQIADGYVDLVLGERTEAR